MNGEPRAPDLLDAARRALLDEVLPVLPEEHRLTGLMIANAIAIAAREIEAPEDPEATLLRYVYGEDGDLRRLADDLRQGRVDEHSHPDLVAWLLEATRAQLKVSNPKWLAANDQGSRTHERPTPS